MEDNKKHISDKTISHYIVSSHTIESKEWTPEYAHKVALANLYECLMRGKELFKEDFFIELQTVRDTLVVGRIKKKWIPKFTCPTPNYDQTVFHYKKKEDELYVVWVLPDRNSSFEILANAHLVGPEMKELTQYVLDFSDGSLFKKCKMLNKEDILLDNIVLKEIKDDNERERIPVADRIARTTGNS